MLRYNPSLRMSAFEALDHEWFTADLEKHTSLLKRQNNLHNLSNVINKKFKDDVYNLKKEEI